MRPYCSLQPCPLCHHPEPEEYLQDKQRDYFRCPVCALVYVSSEQFIAQSDERSQYDSHQNSPDDPHYRKFLSRLHVPMNERIAPDSLGLDFGSGPGPTLSIMFEETGHKVSLFDPYYAPDEKVFEATYDFVTSSETIEHVHQPREELSRLWQCLKPGGYLGIMTKLVIDKDAFKVWHYKNEPTHVRFYSCDTFRWLADFWSAKVEFVDKDVTIFQKPAH